VKSQPSTCLREADEKESWTPYIIAEGAAFGLFIFRYSNAEEALSG